MLCGCRLYGFKQAWLPDVGAHTCSRGFLGYIERVSLARGLHSTKARIHSSGCANELANLKVPCTQHLTVFGPNPHRRYGFWNQKPQILSANLFGTHTP